jgi:hypothetical protein
MYRQEKYADIIQKETESGHPLPFGLYTMNKRQKKLVPVGLNINFEARKLSCHCENESCLRELKK